MRRRASTLAAAAIAALALAGATPAVGAVTYETAPAGFCRSTLLRDYLTPLDRLPKLRSPSPSGRLDFGPRSIRLQPLPALLVGGGTIGYKLFLSEGARTQHPDWTVVTALARVNWRGRSAEAHSHARRQVTTVSSSREAGVDFRVNRYPAPYLLTISFRDKTGKELGEYGFYFRVVKATANARLGLSGTAYRPGSTVFARVENLGSSPVTFGAPYAIERPEGTAWVKAPESPKGPWIMPLFWTLGGMTEQGCQGFWIPPTMPPGRYRISKEAQFPALKGPGSDEPRLVSGEFDVTP
ncbi:MAG TPA: immunoglobulin-like domain-containing protein [Solirubrobacterales bacterium]|nr:immunoglobulin-like domain-containing protein [Solirubrobacterales bacterium]